MHEEEKIRKNHGDQRVHIEERIEKQKEQIEDHIEKQKVQIEDHIEKQKVQIEDRIEKQKVQLEEHIEEINHEMGWELGKGDQKPFKEHMKELFNLKMDTADYHVIHDRLVDSANIKGSNMCILMLAILIASIGLNVNSTAVIIGAMLISPLMGSILAMAYGSASLDKKIFIKSLFGFLFQILISLSVSTIYFLLSPLNTATSEILARTTPTFWDVLIAVCGGLAGIIGITRKEKSNVIPGVAIATALMPPLCTCGYSIAHGEWKMLLGAGYLFFVNTYFIFLTSAIVLAVLEVPKVGNVPEKVWKKMKWKVVRNTIIVVIPSIILGILMVKGA